MAQRAISSAVERLPYKQDVAGSNPASRIPPDASQEQRPTTFPLQVFWVTDALRPGWLNWTIQF